MAMSILSVSTAAATVLGVCLNSAAADTTTGAVAGAAEPGTMEDTFTIPYTEFDDTVVSGCGMQFAGCTGELNGACPDCVQHEVEGSITVLDDCTFRIEGWQFDGVGPAVEWWASMIYGEPDAFPYPANAIKIGELGEPGAYQLGSLHGGDSDVVVRLGLDADGNQIEFSDARNHISLWCEDFAVDFGNTPLTCGAEAPGAAADDEAADTETATDGDAATEAEADAETPPNTGTAADDEPADTGAAADTGANDPADTDTATDGDAATTTEPSGADPMYAAVGAAAAVGAFGLALL